MTESIEVGYTNAAIVGDLGIYHKYILYTNNNGEEFIARGGPELGLSSGSSGSDSGGSSGPFPLGNIETQTGEYNKDSLDWDPARDPDDPDSSAMRHPRETIAEGTDLSQQWDKIVETMQRINDSNIPYDPKSENSNASADEALREAGLPAPKLDGPGKYWSPGSDVDLPGGEIPSPVIPDFLDELIEWIQIKVGFDQIKEDVNNFFLQFKNWMPPRTDPLVLDLDNDGIETIGIANTVVVFDHDGDGIKTGTGWVNSDDGFLVFDRNDNGTIDTGAELFGIYTAKTDGSLATDGFDALSDLDSNADNVFDINDESFALVQVWRDFNQNGISTADELFSLSELGIVSIDLNASSQNVNLGNGNIQTAAAAHLTVDGEGQSGNLDLANNPFYREFTDSIPLTDEALNLPDSKASGMVRDLREAVSLSPALASVLTSYSGQTGYADQKAMLDDLISAWAQTSTIKMDRSLQDHWPFLNALQVQFA